MRSIPGLLVQTLALTAMAAAPCVFAQGESLPQSSPALTMASLPPEERGDILMARGRYLEAVGASHALAADEMVGTDLDPRHARRRGQTHDRSSRTVSRSSTV